MDAGTTLTPGTDPIYAALVGVTLPSITQTTAVVTYDYTDMAAGTPYEPTLSHCDFASSTSIKSMSDFGGYWNIGKTVTCADVMKSNKLYNDWVNTYDTALADFDVL